MGCDGGGLSLVVGLEESGLAGMCDEGDPGGWRTSVKGADSMAGDGGVYAVSWSYLLLAYQDGMIRCAVQYEAAAIIAVQ